MTLIFALIACTGGDTADTGKTTDTSDTGTSAACATMSSGTDWAWDGECPQMVTPCDIVVTECSFVIDYEADGGMTMSMPFGGVIVDDQVTFNNDNGVTGCVGTLVDADTVEGSCADGCTFTLSR
jgi:hypothetical protein